MCDLKVEGSPEPGPFCLLRPPGPLSVEIPMPAPAPSKTKPWTAVLLGVKCGDQRFRAVVRPWALSAKT